MHGCRTKARPQQSVKCRRRTAALQMAENRGTRCRDAGGSDLLRNLLANAAQAQATARPHSHIMWLACHLHRPLGDDHNAEAGARTVPLGDLLAKDIYIIGYLWNQNHIAATGDTCLQGDPTNSPPHDFDHHHAMMALSSGVQLINGLGGGL